MSDYSLAGELFGLLQKQIGSGDLFMCSHCWGGSLKPAAVCFEWRGAAKAERLVTFKMLRDSSLESLASRIAESLQEPEQKTLAEQVQELGEFEPDPNDSFA